MMVTYKTLLILPTLLFLIGTPFVYAQVTDNTIGGIIIPHITSTQAKYCVNGFCSTGSGPVKQSTNDSNHEMQTKYPIIMVIPAELCTKALKYNLKTNCPSLQSIMKYDNSNQNISGHFYSTDNIKYERTKAQVKNHWQYYTYSNHTIVCVYCTGNYQTADLYKEIIIEPNSFEYIPHSSAELNVKNSGLVSFLNRSMQGCTTATIAYSDFLLNDTIHYLESGCQVTGTSYNKTNTQIIHSTPWIYNNPYSSLHYKTLVDKIKTTHPGYCINMNCSYTTSTKKAGW